MNKIILFFAFLVLCNCTNNYSIEGTIDGINSGKALMIEVTGTGDEAVLKNTIIKNGKFGFEGEVKHPKVTYIILNDTYKFLFFLEKGTIKISADTLQKIIYDDYIELNPSIKGSDLNDLYRAYSKQIDSLHNLQKFKQTNKIMLSYAEALKNNDEIQIESIENRLDAIDEQLFVAENKVRKDFAIAHGNSIVAPYVMLNEGEGFTENAYSKKELKAIFKSFDKSISFSCDYKECEAKLLAIENLSIGNKAPSFTLKTNKGNSISLSDFKGKYVLLDFWAHWCAPCVDQLTEYNQLYEKYQGKDFEIIGISIDPEIEPWKETIEAHNTPWTQCIIPFDRNENLGRKYNIESLPTNYLVGTYGQILGKNLSIDALEEFLNRLNSNQQ